MHYIAPLGLLGHFRKFSFIPSMDIPFGKTDCQKSSHVQTLIRPLVFRHSYCIVKGPISYVHFPTSSFFTHAGVQESAHYWCCGFSVLSEATQTHSCGQHVCFPPRRIPAQRWCKLALSQHVKVLIVSNPSPSAPLLRSFSPVIQLALQRELSFRPTAGPVPTATPACRQAPCWHRRHNKTPTCVSDTPPPSLPQMHPLVQTDAHTRASWACL